MPTTRNSIRDVLALLRPGMRVLLHAGPAACRALLDALRENPEHAAGVTFTGLFLPGLDDTDLAALTPTTRVETVFASPAVRESFAAGRHAFLPIHYSAVPEWLASRPADLAVLHLPPAERGAFSCGLAADIADGVQRYAKRVAVLVDPAIPRTFGATALQVDDAALIAETDAPLPPYVPPRQDPTTTALARRVASLIDDGDVLQIGLGKLPSAVLRELGDRRDLRLHTGMIVEEVAHLVEAGALAAPLLPDTPSVLTGIAVGGEKLHALLTDPAFAFHGVAVTHDARRIARLPRFTAINTAIEVDLFGNVNCETVNGRQVSGIGGAADFCRAARLSEGGRAIVALPAQAKSISRIVPKLSAGTTSLGRADIDILVTEHGTARLRHLSLDARAETIMSLAAPEHREMLAEAWRTVRGSL